MSTANLQAVNKAISSPESVIEDRSAFNGQSCFKYSGKCVNLNDDDAMSAACGTGNTVVGWDDAGCGTSKCVSRSHFSFSIPYRHYDPSQQDSVFD